jgi:hypothetical protein
LLNNAKLAPDVREALNAGIADGRLGKIDQGDGQAVSIKAAPAGGWKLK